MGVFDCMCCESGLVIDSDQQLIVILENAKETWAPLALPIGGTNNRYGTMDVPRRIDANMTSVVALGKTLAYRDESVKPAKVDLERLLDEIRADGPGARRGKQRVSFALIDDAVYRAIVAAVRENGATAWQRYAHVGLATPEPPLPNRTKAEAKPAPAIDATTRRLCEAILATPDDEAPRKVYVDHLLERGDPRGRLLSLLPALRKLRFEDLAALALVDPAIYAGADRAALASALVDFVRFLAWGTRLVPASGEGQFFGYERDDGEEWGIVAPYVARARTKYAGMPELLAAVDGNEKAWRERGE